MRIALGFRVHSGWAAMVAAAGTVAAPRIVERRRIVIADADLPGSKQPYHAAADLPIPKAEALVRRATDSSRALAAEATEASLQALRSLGHDVGACGVVLGSGNPLPELGRILASHALIHTAEGEMFRDAVVRAARLHGLPVAGLRAKEIDATALRRIDSLGELIGPPWTQDQKFATLAALTALSLA
jgi:hypothetical protein